jgi:hypothetical protein
MFAFFAGVAAGLLHVFSGPDHLAAVAPLVLGEKRAHGVRRSRVEGLASGFQWGVGHTAGVLLIATLLLFLKEQLPLDLISIYSERLVGLSLIAIGIWGMWGAWVRECGGARVHGHSHAGASFAMGTLHGFAGSSHLFGVLPALAFSARIDSLVYLAGFGTGAIAGMSAFAAGMGMLSIRVGGQQHHRYRGLLYASSAAAIVIGGFWLAAR